MGHGTVQPQNNFLKIDYEALNTFDINILIFEIITKNHKHIRFLIKKNDKRYHFI